MKNLIIIVSIIIFSTCRAEQYADFSKIADQYFKELIEDNPEYAASLGIPDSLGYDLHKDKLNDFSPEHDRKAFDIIKKYKQILSKIDESRISAKDKIYFDVMKWDSDTYLLSEKYVSYGYLITSMFSFHSSNITLFTDYHAIENKTDIEDYLKRLSLVEKKFDQVHKQQDLRDKIGACPPDFIAAQFIEQLNEFLGDKIPETNIYYTTLDLKMKDMGISAEDKTVYLDRARSIIKNSIYPAYEKMIVRAQKIVDMKDSRAGVWKLPDGDEYYKYCLKLHTTTGLSPEEVHQIGIKEVKRIQDEMMTMFAELGFKGDNFAAVEDEWYNATKSAPENNYPNTEEGKQQAVGDYMKIIEDVKKKLPDYFSLLPKADIVVKRVPEYKVTGAGAFYDSPSYDGKRTGVFYIDMQKPPRKAGMATLTYHEAIPGHHLQYSLQHEIDYLKYFRSLFAYNGFQEGWALYAETLAYEEGWNKDINAKLSYLNSELYRAARLVLDTGIHYKRWSFEEAGRNMKEMLGYISMGELYRYCVWPGQACSYKIGEMKILELRERMKRELKDKFDIKEFHRLVLEDGQKPLEILEKKIDKYIAEKKGF
jgi:uncharacterized protein (DUF885 family)